MLISIKNKNFSGLLIKDDPKDLIIQLKPFNKKSFVRIKEGNYYYLNDDDVKKII